jgi:peptidoglycan/xylan/chitin deacetylase (PgdA/CDA1 family)
MQATWRQPQRSRSDDRGRARTLSRCHLLIPFRPEGRSIQVRNGRLLSLPYSLDLNEGWNLRFNVDAEEFVLGVKDQFDRLYQEGGRVMSLALHPYVFGQPHRIAHLDKLLAYILSHSGVWQATGFEIADWFNKTHLPLLQQSMTELPLENSPAFVARA